MSNVDFVWIPVYFSAMNECLYGRSIPSWDERGPSYSTHVPVQKRNKLGSISLPKLYFFNYASL